MHALMIDVDSSRDRDDAITVSPTIDGWEATVYVAAVADHVALNGPVDRAAARQGRTIYAPGHHRPMLGRTVEQDATLRSDIDQSALAISMAFTSHGERIGQATVSRQRMPAGFFVPIDHQRTVQALADPANPLHEATTHAHQLARSLAAARASAGALVVYDGAHRVMTSEDGRLVQITAGAPEAHLIVQELMVAANRAIAGWAIARELPILFRNHRRSPMAPPASDRSAEVHAVLSSIDGAFDVSALAQRINLTVTKAVYEPVVDGHYGLQVPAYTHATSPLRRYADLVTQRIVLAAIDEHESPYSGETLAAIGESLAAADETADETASEAYKSRANRSAARAIAARSLPGLDEKSFVRVLKVALPEQPVPAVVGELLRRAREGMLTPGQAGLLFQAGHAGWSPVVADVLSAIRIQSPTVAMSVWMVRLQLLTRSTEQPEFDVVQAGPPHEPTFAVRAHHDGIWSTWEVSSSRKSAEQQCVWRLLLTLAGRETSADPAEEPPISPSSSSEPPTPPPSGGRDIPASVWSSMLGDTPARIDKKRAAALKNPVGWLNSLMTAAGWDRPAITQESTGPAHEPEFTVTIAAGPSTETRTESTVKAARSAAATAVVATLFDTAAQLLSEQESPS